MNTILLVEDDDATRIIAENYLSQTFRIIPYETATHAIQDIKSYIRSIDIAVVDIIYNDFRNGVDVWRYLRDCGFRGPIIFFTGVVPESRDYKQALFCINSDRNRSLSSCILLKPQTLEALEQKIQEVVKALKPKLNLVKLEQIPKKIGVEHGC